MALSADVRIADREREEGAGRAPAIVALDAIHRHAVESGASDVHVEPSGAGGRVRQRVDGKLVETIRLPADLLDPVIARIKMLAGIDVAERRTPQDGRYSVTVDGRRFDARVSSLPTIDGERVAIRILDGDGAAHSLEELGMPTQVYGKYRRAAGAAHGFVVVCGPTGSGKTTTLYAALRARNEDGQQLCTVEDPVEIRIPGVAQVQVNAKAGITFSTALRAFLRQDPDVVMIGEMRDAQTASVAAAAALSGHLVLTTLHAPDAPRAVDRLSDLGLPRGVLAACLSGVLSQRLVRRLCERCRRPVRAGAADARRFGLAEGTPAFESAGCDACAGTGYRGRLGIFEFLPVTPAVRRTIAAGAAAAHACGDRRKRRLSPAALRRTGARGFRHDDAGRVASSRARREAGNGKLSGDSLGRRTRDRYGAQRFRPASRTRLRSDDPRGRHPRRARLRCDQRRRDRRVGDASLDRRSRETLERAGDVSLSCEARATEPCACTRSAPMAEPTWPSGCSDEKPRRSRRLSLPGVVEDLTLRLRGLLLFSGPTGSGKSTRWRRPSTSSMQRRESGSLRLRTRSNSATYLAARPFASAKSAATRPASRRRSSGRCAAIPTLSPSAKCAPPRRCASPSPPRRRDIS